MAIRLEDIHKYYDKQEVLKGINLHIPLGGVVGFLGPNGAGKSTLMKIVIGLISPTSGRVFVKGLEVNQHALETRRHIGYLPEHNPLYLDMYVKEYLQMVGEMFGVENKTKACQFAIDQTGLGNESGKKIGQLSKGYRQRVGLAQTLLHQPDILILDEPTTGLDPNQIIEIRELIAQLGREKTVLFSSHIMQEVEALCQRVLIVNKGSIVADGTTAELRNKLHGQGVIVVFNQAPSEEILLTAGFADRIIQERIVNDQQYTFLSNKDIRVDLFRWAVAQQLEIVEMRNTSNHLEEIFHQMTAGT